LHKNVIIAEVFTSGEDEGSSAISLFNA